MGSTTIMDKTSLLLTVAISSYLPSVSAISCYECDSSKNFSCTEYWDPSLTVVQDFITDCSHVFEAQYCVKMTGIFEGKLGTKRFCSSRDWGYYCEYIKRPGDIQEYRSCIYSCTSSQCNIGSSMTSASMFLINPMMLSIIRTLL